MPPYSSTTMARWFDSSCICRSVSSAFFDSGTNSAGAREVAAVDRVGAERLLEAQPGDVAQVEDADDFVGVVADDRHAGDARC